MSEKTTIVIQMDGNYPDISSGIVSFENSKTGTKISVRPADLESGIYVRYAHRRLALRWAYGTTYQKYHYEFTNDEASYGILARVILYFQKVLLLF